MDRCGSRLLGDSRLVAATLATTEQAPTTCWLLDEQDLNRFFVDGERCFVNGERFLGDRLDGLRRDRRGGLLGGRPRERLGLCLGQQRREAAVSHDRLVTGSSTTSATTAGSAVVP